MTRRQRIDEIVRRPYSIEFEYGDQAEEGVLAYAAEWPDCFAAGGTREEALAALERTMRDLVAYRLDHTLEIPDPVAFSGRLVLRLPRGLHRAAAHRASAEGASLNGWLVSAIARELGPRSELAPPDGAAVRERKAAYGARRLPRAMRSPRRNV